MTAKVRQFYKGDCCDAWAHPNLHIEMCAGSIQWERVAPAGGVRGKKCAARAAADRGIFLGARSGKPRGRGAAHCGIQCGKAGRRIKGAGIEATRVGASTGKAGMNVGLHRPLRRLVRLLRWDYHLRGCPGLVKALVVTAAVLAAVAHKRERYARQQRLR